MIAARPVECRREPATRQPQPSSDAELLEVPVLTVVFEVPLMAFVPPTLVVWSWPVTPPTPLVPIPDPPTLVVPTVLVVSLPPIVPIAVDWLVAVKPPVPLAPLEP